MLYSPLIQSPSMVDKRDKNAIQIRSDLLRTRIELEELMKLEVFNADTGLGEDLEGNSKATLQVTIRKAKNLHHSKGIWGKPNPYVLISLDPEEICPDTTVRRTKTKKDTGFPTWDAQFVFAPILSRVGYIKLVVMDESRFPTNRVLGEFRISLSKLLSQQTVEEWYDMHLPGEEGSTPAKILVASKFQFSMILPLQLAIETLQKEMEECSNFQEPAVVKDKEVQNSHKTSPLEDIPLHTSLGDFLDTDGVLRRKGKQGDNQQVSLAQPSKSSTFWNVVAQILDSVEPTWLFTENDNDSLKNRSSTTSEQSHSNNIQSTPKDTHDTIDSLFRQNSVTEWLLPEKPTRLPVTKGDRRSSFYAGQLSPLNSPLNSPLSPKSPISTPSAQTA